MAANTAIEWATHTFNHVRGCTKISPGCKNCYAETLSGRNPGTLGVWGPNGTRVVASEATWRDPLKWDAAAKAALEQWRADSYGFPFNPPYPKPERPRVFCASLADVFEDWTGPMAAASGKALHVDERGSWFGLPEGKKTNCRPLTMDNVRERLFDVIRETPHLDWLLLSKRPENFPRMLPWFDVPGSASEPWPNVWLGVSVENRKHGLPRIDILRNTPAAVRFLSIEPLLEDLGPLDLAGIHWVIVGGESGSKARPFQIEWARSILTQCKAANVACFIKQLGSNPTASYYDEFREEWESCRGLEWPEAIGWNHRDGQPPLSSRVALPMSKKGGGYYEWPRDLQVREFPNTPVESR